MRVVLDDAACVAHGELQRFCECDDLRGQVSASPRLVGIRQILVREDGREWIEPVLRLSDLLPRILRPAQRTPLIVGDGPCIIRVIVAPELHRATRINPGNDLSLLHPAGYRVFEDKGKDDLAVLWIYDFPDQHWIKVDPTWILHPLLCWNQLDKGLPAHATILDNLSEQ